MKLTPPDISHLLQKGYPCTRKAVILLTAFIATAIVLMPRPAAVAQSDSDPPPSKNTAAEALKLTRSVMCEQVQKGVPINKSVIFSISGEKVNCFTVFDPVPRDTFIYHNWFRRDRLSTKRKLSLKSPRWKTFSSIHLRESDIGPWRVEITDSEGHILDVLQFSVTE